MTGQTGFFAESPERFCAPDVQSARQGNRILSDSALHKLPSDLDKDPEASSLPGETAPATKVSNRLHGIFTFTRGAKRDMLRYRTDQ